MWRYWYSSPNRPLTSSPTAADLCSIYMYVRDSVCVYLCAYLSMYVCVRCDARARPPPHSRGIVVVIHGRGVHHRTARALHPPHPLGHVAEARGAVGTAADGAVVALRRRADASHLLFFMFFFGICFGIFRFLNITFRGIVLGVLCSFGGSGGFEIKWKLVKRRRREVSPGLCLCK